jgi:hypothetical protein
MKKKLFLPFVAILLLSCGSIYGYNNDTSRDLAIHSEVTEPSALTILSDNASAAETTVSRNQTFEVKNPTFQELKDFILKDPTSRKQFVLNQYECRHFATEVDNNAEAAGLRCGFALLCYDQGQHAVVAFETTDRGLVYIEPQTDAAIDVKVGGMYEGREIKEILIAW